MLVPDWWTQHKQSEFLVMWHVRSALWTLHRTNLRWRFQKILWPSQNIWTLKLWVDFGVSVFNCQIRITVVYYTVARCLVWGTCAVCTYLARMRRAAGMMWFRRPLCGIWIQILGTFSWGRLQAPDCHNRRPKWVLCFLFSSCWRPYSSLVFHIWHVFSIP